MCNRPAPKDFEKAIQPNTRLIYFESPSNPILEILDIAALAGIARAHGIPSMMDNTFASPALQQPLKLGITVVVHSATKYLCGHGDAMGGAAIGTKDYIEHLNLDVLRDFGGVMSPFTAWLMLRGIRTLHLRMPAHCANAQKVAEFLAQHPKVERVNYPGLPGHPGHELAKRQMKAFGAMMSFEAKGGYEGGKRVMDRVKIFLRAASLGDTRSLIVHSASTSHRAVPPEQRQAIGITDGLVRLSVGIEAVEDLIQDLDQALAGRPGGAANRALHAFCVGRSEELRMLQLISLLMVIYSYFLIQTNIPKLPQAHSDALQRCRCGRWVGKSRHPLGLVGRAGSYLHGLPVMPYIGQRFPGAVHFGSRRLSDFSPAQRERA